MNNTHDILLVFFFHFSFSRVQNNKTNCCGYGFRLPFIFKSITTHWFICFVHCLYYILFYFFLQRRRLPTNPICMGLFLRFCRYCSGPKWNCPLIKCMTTIRLCKAQTMAYQRALRLISNVTHKRIHRMSHTNGLSMICLSLAIIPRKWYVLRT